MKKKSTPKRIKPTIKKDPIHPADWMSYKLPWSCEECSHFDSENQNCTLGYPTAPHLKTEQQKSFEISGKIAVCRFHEID